MNLNLLNQRVYRTYRSELILRVVYFITLKTFLIDYKMNRNIRLEVRCTQKPLKAINLTNKIKNLFQYQ
jgi:hypothetical protein